MSDRTEAEEEEFVRTHARRTRISPERLLSDLKPLGFLLSRVDLDDGMNEIEFIRDSPACPGLFDRVTVEGTLTGDSASLDVRTSITPGEIELAITDCVMLEPEEIESFSFRSGSQQDARRSESSIIKMIPRCFAALQDRQTTLHEETATARASVEKYLIFLQPSKDLDETWQRLSTGCDPASAELSERYLKTQYLHTMNLRDFRKVWQIAQLTQLLCWEGDPADVRGFNDQLGKKTEGQVEAHRRLQILASRLGREPGWPEQDMLVPSRDDELIREVPWRHRRLSAVEEAIDGYLSQSCAPCPCGRPWRFLRQPQSTDSATTSLSVHVRCANGHEDQLQIDLQNLRS